MANIEMRKKAINGMMLGKPSLSISKKKSPLDGLSLPTPVEGEEVGPGAEGLVSMMVTPEEKEMIEAMREEGGAPAEEAPAPSGLGLE